jgi:MFS family permease
MQLLAKQRIALSSFFFLAGLTFASWTSRIPTLKTALNMNEAQLGTTLLVMPVSSFIGLGLAGWLIEKYESRWPLLWSFCFLTVFIILIGKSDTILFFSVAIFLFALANRVLNIAINTQAINLQNLYPKKINGSFHGLWSVGGIAGVGTTTLMVANEIGIEAHFYFISALTLICTTVLFTILLKNDKSKTAGKIVWKKPDPVILILGLIILLTATVEGGMFDWSGIYFKDVVHVDIFTMGYFIFMTFMAISRFTSDWIISHLGMKKMFVLSASTIAVGLAIAVIFPFFIPAMVGFSLVGIGTASVIPMTLTLTGNSTKYSPGIAISLVSTFAMVGVLTAPPLIGFLAHFFGLRVSFIFLIMSSLAIIPASAKFFKLKESLKTGI